jgi:hypothetical protein
MERPASQAVQFFLGTADAAPAAGLLPIGFQLRWCLQLMARLKAALAILFRILPAESRQSASTCLID